jgi:hypothetical protein
LLIGIVAKFKQELDRNGVSLIASPMQAGPARLHNSLGRKKRREGGGAHLVNGICRHGKLLRQEVDEEQRSRRMNGQMEGVEALKIC